MRTARVLTLLPSGAKTATYNTQNTPVQVTGFREIDVYLDVTAVSGTSPTMTVTIQKRNGVDGKWYPLIVFPQVTATTSICLEAPSNIGYEISISAVIGGTTPSFTHSIVAVLKD